MPAGGRGHAIGTYLPGVGGEVDKSGVPLPHHTEAVSFLRLGGRSRGCEPGREGPAVLGGEGGGAEGRRLG